MKKNKIFFLTIVCIFLLSFVSANGLQVINQSEYQINKTVGINKVITFDLYNDDSVTFYNITFESNSVITMSQVNSLEPGQTKEVSAIVTTDDDFDGQIRIKGLYLASLGQPFNNYEVTVDFSDGIEPCDFSIINGDSVIWINEVNDDIKMKNYDTGQEVTTIALGEEWTSNFDTPEIFNYYFLRRGFQFTDVCTITALDDEGYINDPQLDGFLSLSLDVNYEPTTVDITVYETNYSLDFFGTTDGIINIKNTGTKVAKDVTLVGDWFSFNYNHFDLALGESKAVIYTISPVIFQSEDTGKYYKKNISISGNFNEVEKEFDIYIKSAVIDENYSDSSFIIAILEQYCLENPNTSWCNPESKVVYKTVTNESDEFNVTYSQEQVTEMTALIFDVLDEMGVSSNYQKEVMNQINEYFNSTEYKVGNLESLVLEEKEARQSDVDLGVFIVIFIFFSAIVALSILLIIEIKKKKKMQMLETM